MAGLSASATADAPLSCEMAETVEARLLLPLPPPTLLGALLPRP